MTQRARPLSPHLQVYRFQWPMLLSITHRFTGVGLAGGVIVLVWWLIALAIGPEYYAYTQALLGSWVGRLLLLGWTWATFYHLCNVMVPLVLWFAFSLAALGPADYATASAWLAHPVNAVLALVLIAAMFHHLHLGLEVIIEDYIHSRWIKFAMLILQKFVTVIFGFGAAFAVLKIALS